MHPVERRAISDAGFPVLSLGWALLLGAGAVSLIALTVSAQIYLSMLTHGHSFYRIAAWQLTSWSVWAAATPLVLRLGARLSDRSSPLRNHVLPVIATGFGIVTVHALVGSLSTVWFQPYVPVQTFRFGTALILQRLSLPVDLLVFGLMLLAGSSMAVYNRARILELRESRLEADLARSQLDALRLEIEPHFLFNTLNSIGSLIRARSGDRALSMLLGLSELLRATIDGTRDHTTTLGAEAAFVKRYIELQRARFSDRLEVTYDLSPESEACVVPSFLLQPVVENAFRHGLTKRSGPCRLELAASVEGADLHVQVRDDGAGLPTNFSLDRHAGTGLRNTAQRLERLYDRAARLTLEPADGGGTVVHIRLPAQAGEQERRALR
jgi:signal transduction histidine kinase